LNIKRLTGALITLAIAVPLTVIAQEESNRQTLLRDFGRSVIDDGSVRITVIHLNDATVEAFFTPPTKYSLRVQAKQTTIFYVQGTAERSMRLDGEWEVRQESRVIQAKTIDIFNFKPGIVLADGDQFTGLVVLDQLVNPRAEFTLGTESNGELYRFNFLFSANAVAQIDGR